MSWFDENENDRREIAQERLVLQMTDLICEAMNERGVNRAELARRLSVSPSEVSMRLKGTRNLTLASIAAMLDSMAYDVESVLVDRRSDAWLAFNTRRTYSGPPIRYTSTGRRITVVEGAA